MAWRYKEVTIGDHPRRRPNGTVLEHMLVAEMKLGRELKTHEVVHHMDENRRNNDSDNLLVFMTQADHSRFHKMKKPIIVKRSDGAYVCTQPARKSQIVRSSRAVGQNYQPTKIDWPSIEELHRRLAASNYSALGRELGVSDNAIRKRLRNHGGIV